MENDIIFKKVNFGGFDRDDVMNYISKITDEFHDKTAQKDKELKEANERANSLTSEIERLKNENKELRDRCDKLESEKAEREKAQKTEPDNAGAESETETAKLKEMVEALIAKVNELMAETPKEKESAPADDRDEYDRDLFDIIEQYVD
ncbi:MAG: hypothetical protein ACI4GA_01470 [Acutalibacteraceae bacterium]|nr:hypothetical protein [Oscillospiraceae bacterium]